MLSKLAEVVTDYSVEIEEGDLVVIQSSYLAEPLLEKVVENVVKKGANFEYKVQLANMDEILFTHAKKEQLEYVSPITKTTVEEADVMISLWADINPKRLNSIESQKLSTRAAARAEITKIFMEREAKGELQWTLAPYPTQAMAQEAGISFLEYRNFVYGACLLDKENPIEEWRKVSKKQEKIVDHLNGKEEIRYVGEDTDLTLSAKGREWINCDGEKNMPDGEVFTGPVEDSANGTIRFTYPGIYMGKEIKDIRLRFEDGKVVNAEAAKGQELLEKLLEIDGVERIGEIAIGTNYGIQRFTKNMLFDEKMGGTMHLALGRSIPESGGKNQSSIHWDLLKDMKKGGKIYADGELFYENGKFLI
ncbi:MAG: aminopeptidase [Euryarchaeota archaeon]|nr:aminopeptidase [Euryarchaeota archaeon]